MYLSRISNPKYTNTGSKWIQIKTIDLVCHTYCDTGHLFWLRGTLTRYTLTFTAVVKRVAVNTTCFNHLINAAAHVPEKVIRLVNVRILLAVLLAQRWQMTLAQRHFAHRPNVIANGWFDVDPSSLAQEVLHMPTTLPTILYQILSCPWKKSWNLVDWDTYYMQQYHVFLLT